MSFRNPAAALVQVGLAPGRQVIIDPTAAGQITFPNPFGMTPAQIGTTAFAGGETLDLIGPADPAEPLDGPAHMRFNAAPTAPPSWSVDLFDSSAGRSMFLRLDATAGLQAQLGAAAVGNNFYGYVPIVLNNSGYGAGTRWVATITFHSVAVTAGVAFNVNLPQTFPAGPSGFHAWPSVRNNFALVSVVQMFPGGNLAQVQCICNATGNVDFGLLSICQYT